ncbi:MAG: high-potential iron-sulfur protein, partial [Woeseia sp.]
APAAQSAAMPKLMENDPQATALGYVHDSSTVDSAKQPRHQAGQACVNCALYTGADGDEWGGCSIFPGKLVAAAGWCSVYAPKG